MSIPPLSNSARIAILAAAALTLTACAHGRDDHYSTPAPYHRSGVTYHDYWYYPALGCYYDPHARVYLYYERDRWLRARALPPHLRPRLGAHVTVRAPHDRPYEEHHRHRERYKPERYRDAAPYDRDGDVWLGPPRREPSPRYDDRRHQDARDPHRRPPAGVRDDDRRPDSTPAPRDHRDSNQDDRRMPPVRNRQMPDGERPPAAAAPAKRENAARERELRQEQSQPRSRTTHDRPHDDGRRGDPPVRYKPGPRHYPDATPYER